MSNLIHVSRRRHGHPLLVAGIIVGLIAGIFLAIPKKIRGWVILLFLTLVAGFWFGWAAHRDQALAGTVQPVPAAEHHTVWVQNLQDQYAASPDATHYDALQRGYLWENDLKKFYGNDFPVYCYPPLDWAPRAERVK